VAGATFFPNMGRCAKGYVSSTPLNHPMRSPRTASWAYFRFVPVLPPPGRKGVEVRRGLAVGVVTGNRNKGTARGAQTEVITLNSGRGTGVPLPNRLV
jgi:hypothetical protein